MQRKWACSGMNLKGEVFRRDRIRKEYISGSLRVTDIKDKMRGCLGVVRSELTVRRYMVTCGKDGTLVENTRAWKTAICWPDPAIYGIRICVVVVSSEIVSILWICKMFLHFDPLDSLWECPFTWALHCLCWIVWFNFQVVCWLLSYFMSSYTSLLQWFDVWDKLPCI